MTLIKPVTSGYTITSRYGARWGSTHTGTDVGASTGTPIYAAASGTVLFSGWKGTLGKLVVINHGNGVQTYYAHCSKIIASVGDEVSKGDLIGLVGSTGRSSGPHVHLEVRYEGKTLDPEVFVYSK